MIWDEGVIHWNETEGASPTEMLKKGQLVFELAGKKLKGSFHLIKTHYGKQKDSWLLMKGKDEHASEKDILEAEPNSARTGRSMEEIAQEGTGKKQG